MISTHEVQNLLDSGGTVTGNNDTKIGKIGQVFLDDQSGKPEWVTVKIGMFGNAESFIPLAEASVSGNDIQVPYDKDKVKDAPRIGESEDHLSPDEEAELYRYYGLGYSEAKSDSALPSGGNSKDRNSDQGRDRDSDRNGVYDDAEGTAVGHDTSGPTTDDAMTRSEEQLRVGTEKREAGRARLRKFVVTENVTQTVPVSHEEVRIEREPITDANHGDAVDGPELSEEEHEVTLHEERPVVDKETVPVERVRLDKETVTENQRVDEQVRKEQIETEGGTSQSNNGKRGKK